jgi:hypothetical protein
LIGAERRHRNPDAKSSPLPKEQIHKFPRTACCKFANARLSNKLRDGEAGEAIPSLSIFLVSIEQEDQNKQLYP